MTISILTENCAGAEFLAEHGLSYLIEVDGEKILFDTGHSDIFIKNAKKLGVDIQNEVETVVLSHGHWDHGNGLQYINNKTLITHPDAFMQRFRNRDHSSIGLKLSKNTIAQKFRLILKRNPYYISDSIVFLGEIPRENDFEAKKTSFEDEFGQPDFVLDDSAIAIIQNNEIVIVTGCSHSGICNIIEYAKKVTGIDNVKAVIGGFHLKQNDLQTQETINFLEKSQISNVHPSHCTAMPALVAFHEIFKMEQLKTGTILKF